MILSSSGGLVYHARAALGHKAWRRTRESVSQHVKEWIETVRASELIIFGPSAAYLLASDSFSTLLDSRRLIVVEPDRVAEIIFRRRFRKHPITWHARADLLPFQSREEATFSDFIQAWPDAAILFHGVLGQIELHEKQATRGRAKARSLLIKALEHRNWMSVYDVASAELASALHTDFELPPLLSEASMATSAPGGPVVSTGTATPSETAVFETADLFESTLQLVAQDLQDRHHTTVTTWIDHDTQWIGSPEILIPWRLHPRRLHLLGISSNNLRFEKK